MKEFYWALRDGKLSDEQVIDYFLNIDYELVEDFESGMGEKFMSVLLEYYFHLFDHIFNIISKNKKLLKIMMDEGSDEEHVFHHYLGKIDVFNIPLVLDILEKYWTREGKRMYHLLYSLEEYCEIRNTMQFYSEEGKLEELKKELRKRRVKKSEFDFGEFENF